ncbi:hypothetical protein F2Q68_00009614 [Brassica cretica]|uniref:Uncharacterized protein n=1 Tax=Brassica cretica TaxID=69181 RepID=A0A8S9KYK2_BRACR|nr:hypothetical protein F2Q68_00009614 [Brassica cretica]
MSKRIGSSIPLTAEKVKSKRRMDSPISKSDSSSDPHDETEHNLLAPAPLSYAPLIPPLNLEDVKCLPLGVNKVLYAYHLAPISGGEVHFHLRPCSGLPIIEELSKNDRKANVFRKKWHERYAFMILPGSFYQWNFVDREKVTFFARERFPSNAIRWCTFLAQRRRCAISDGRFPGGDKGGVGEKGSVSKDTSDDDMTITESRRNTVVKVEPTSSSQGKNSKDGVVTRSARQSSRHWALFWWAIHCSLQLELQSISSGSDSSFGGRTFGGDSSFPWRTPSGEGLSEEGLSSNREELEKLICQLSKEKGKCAAREMEICDLQAKVKAQESMVEASSAEALTLGKEKQELEKIMSDLRKSVETFMYEMVMAVNGARITARWELMREWLRR